MFYYLLNNEFTWKGIFKSNLEAKSKWNGLPALKFGVVSSSDTEDTEYSEKYLGCYEYELNEEVVKLGFELYDNLKSKEF